jgi:hypothetical protein
MKKLFMVAIAISFLAVSAYAGDHVDYKCDYKYYRGIKKVNSLYEMSDETKNKWISKLTEIHQLCMDGKDKEASQIMEELSKDKEWDTVFSTYDSN